MYIGKDSKAILHLNYITLVTALSSHQKEWAPSYTCNTAPILHFISVIAMPAVWSK